MIVYCLDEHVVVCKLTPLQVDLYKLFAKSTLAAGLEDTEESAKLSTTTLSAITQMKKLCNRKPSPQDSV